MDVFVLNLLMVGLIALPVVDIVCTAFMYRLYRRTAEKRGGVPNIILRDRLVASVIQTTTVTLVGLLAFDRVIGSPVDLRGEWTTFVLAIALLILAIPPIYWFWHIYRGRA